jgi:hypothetical protein
VLFCLEPGIPPGTWVRKRVCLFWSQCLRAG